MMPYLRCPWHVVHVNAFWQSLSADTFQAWAQVIYNLLTSHAALLSESELQLESSLIMMFWFSSEAHWKFLITDEHTDQVTDAN